MSPITLKAASGAAEAVKLLSVHDTTGFIGKSQKNGWKVYAAIAPPTKQPSALEPTHLNLDSISQSLQNSPCVLLLGGEGTGIKQDLVLLCDYTLSIPGQRSHQNGLDSLNVSVAAGIMMNGFLAPSTIVEKPKAPSEQLF